MMDRLRVISNHFIFKIILVLMILSFILTGVSSYLLFDSGEYAAKVNGQVITLTQLEQVFQNERQYIQSKLGDQFSLLSSNPNYIQQMRQQALSRLIDHILLVQYSKKLGLTVSNQQIKNIIQKVHYFQTDGQFDNSRYLEFIKRMNYSTEDFSHFMQDELVKQYIIEAFGESGFILPSESQAISALMFQQRNVRLAKINLNVLQAKQKVTEDQLKSYYYYNKNSFILPQKIKVSYIPIDTVSMQNKVIVSKAEISNFYNQHKSNYIQPEKRSYSLIQLHTKEDANTVLHELKKGGNFATLAKEKSTDIISRRTGGMLAWLEPKTTIDELKNIHLTTKGQISNVVKSSVGYLIVRLNDIIPEKITPIRDVYKDIAEQIRKEKALDAYHVLQQKISIAINRDHASLDFVETVSGVKAVKTGWFSRNNIPTALNVQPVVESIFDRSLISKNGKLDNNCSIIPVDANRAFAVCMIAHQVESIASFDQVKNHVAEILKHNQALKKAIKQAEKILHELRRGKGDKVMHAASLRFGKIQTITRSVKSNPLIEDIFSLPHPLKNKLVYGISQDDQNNVVLIALDSVKPGRLSADAKKMFAKKIEEASAKTSISCLLASLRKEATIKIGSIE
ncbi:peptidylprolyl isomerase [Candidatus Gillettellia adelgis]